MLGYYASSVSNPEIEFVLFDLGGVIIELGDVSSLQEMAAPVGDEEHWHQWLASPWASFGSRRVNVLRQSSPPRL